MTIVRVIRVIEYKGEEAAVRAAIAQSLPLGAKNCTGYTITVAEHLNELTPQLDLSCGQVQAALKRTKEAE